MAERNALAMTKVYFPSPLTLDQFVNEVQNGIGAFRENMINLGAPTQYAEDWMDIFRSWMEMEHETYPASRGTWKNGSPIVGNSNPEGRTNQQVEDK